jgi:hypothetical protein
MSKDLNQLGAHIMSVTTGTKLEITKNPAAVALGRLGGLKGGKARAASMSAAKRKAIAKQGAVARWKKAA